MKIGIVQILRADCLYIYIYPIGVSTVVCVRIRDLYE